METPNKCDDNETLGCFESQEPISQPEIDQEFNQDNTDITTSDRTFETPICSGEYTHNHFFKGCLWSPDDNPNRLLTCDGNNKLRIHHAFLNKIDYSTSQISSDFFELRNIGKIYDYNWFPLNSSTSYYILTATSLGPVHIWNAVSGRSRATYDMYNTKDEAVSARCIATSPDGDKIFAGTSDYIFIFDTNRPGRNYECIYTRENFSKGIISTIAINPLRKSLFAVGSYNNRIGLYDELQPLCLFYGHLKGLTFLKFSPDGLLLYSGTRGSGDMFCWDLRKPGTALYKLIRTVNTQQRIYFDIHKSGRYVISGNTNGDVSIWDTLSAPIENVLSPAHIFKAHNDCTNGISINKDAPVIATVSGQYHDTELSNVLYDSDEEDSYSIESNIENSLKLWHIRW